jgi:MazG family protein
VETTPLTPELSILGELLDLIKRLRGQDGCPWDKQQTPRSMVVHLIEELYELVDAIESGNSPDICEELGDVCFHVFFIAALYQDTGAFNTADMARGIVEKMTRRHPHVFGGTPLIDTETVMSQWQMIKQMEKKKLSDETVSVLDTVPKSLPALMRAYRVAERAANTGFDWNDVHEVMETVEAEMDEFRTALEGESPEAVAMEFGDVLFTLVNVARFARIHPESALTSSTAKFEKRFRWMEQAIADTGRSLVSVPQSEKEIYWTSAKERTHS